MESGKPIYMSVLFIVVAVCFVLFFVLFGNIVSLKIIKIAVTHFLYCTYIPVCGKL